MFTGGYFLFCLPEGNINVKRQLIESDVGSSGYTWIRNVEGFSGKINQQELMKGCLLKGRRTMCQSKTNSNFWVSTGFTNEFENNGDLSRLKNLTDPTIRKSIFQAA